MMAMEAALLRKSLLARSCIGAGLLLAGAGSAWGQDNTVPPPSTQALYEDCVSPDQAKELSCVSYLAGVADTMRLIGSGMEQHNFSDASRAEIAGFGICTPQYTAVDLRRIFVDWAARHPEKSDKYRLFGAINAFYSAWSCH
jgi:Rap1a immunity proteins